MNLPKIYFLICRAFTLCLLAAQLVFFTSGLALAANDCHSQPVIGGCLLINNKSTCNASYLIYQNAYYNCGWESYNDMCYGDEKPCTLSLCHTLNVKLENKSHSTWHYVSSAGISLNESNSTNYQELASIDESGNRNSVLNYDTGDGSSEISVFITYENDQTQEQVKFAVTRHADNTSGSQLSGNVQAGTFNAKMVGSPTSCPDSYSAMTAPSISFEFLDPPVQQIEIKIGFSSENQAKISSKNIFSLINTSLMQGLNITNGKPIQMSVDGKVATFILQKLCAKEGCGYQ